MRGELVHCSRPLSLALAPPMEEVERSRLKIHGFLSSLEAFGFANSGAGTTSITKE